MHIKDIPKFEKQNGLNINVFELDEHICRIYINTNYTKPQSDLLLYNNHYCLITNYIH